MAVTFSSHLDVTNKRLIGAAEGLQWWQTSGVHAAGVGMQDLGIWIPFACTIVAVRYRIFSAGSGGSMAADLRINSSGATAVPGSSQTPSTSPSWSTITSGNTLAVDDLLWCYVNTMTHTTPGSQLKCEVMLVRT